MAPSTGHDFLIWHRACARVAALRSEVGSGNIASRYERALGFINRSWATEVKYIAQLGRSLPAKIVAEHLLYLLQHGLVANPSGSNAKPLHAGNKLVGLLDRLAEYLWLLRRRQSPSYMIVKVNLTPQTMNMTFTILCCKTSQ